MGDEHLDTIPKKESDEFIKSSVENLVSSPSEFEDISDSECDLPLCDDFPKSHLITFSNPLFDINNDFTTSDDESFSEEDVPMENFKIFSNPLHDLDEEIISTELNPIQNEVLESITSIPLGIDYFDAESNLIESLINLNTSIDSTSKFDSLLEEFFSELSHIDLIFPEIDEADFDPEEEIRIVKKLLYDNSSPQPPKEVNSKNSNAIIESFSPSTILVEDSDSLILSNDSPSLPENESFHFDVPSSPRPHAKPSDDGIYFELVTRVWTTKVVGNISEHYVLIPRLLPTQPTLCLVIDTLLPLSSENEDKVHL
nr:hypothetical protein [Tanacetum cinerariifolium]